MNHINGVLKEVGCSRLPWRFFLALTIFLLPAQTAAGQQRDLYKVEKIDPNEDDKQRVNVTRPNKPESIYLIRFRGDEPFVFGVPESLLMQMSGGNPMYADGATNYRYDHDDDKSTRPILIRIPDKLLRVRDTLLYARKFFWNAARDQKIHYTQLPADEPMPVYIGYFPTNDARFAITGSRGAKSKITHHMRIRHDVELQDLECVVVHEFFHIVQRRLFKSPANYSRFYKESNKTDLSFLHDMTAEWASDAPIGITISSRHGPKSVDKINMWVRERDVFLKNPTQKSYFLDRWRYQYVFLIKYWTEQLNGGKDNQGIKHVYRLLNGVHDHGKADRETVSKILADMLPAERYNGSTPQQRFTEFVRDFACANLVQKASSRNSPADRLGYHDDGMSNLAKMIKLSVLTKWTSDFSKRPQQVHTQPAQSQAERQRRLQSIAVGPESGGYRTLAGMTSSWNLIDLTGSRSASDPLESMESRPLFVYAKSDGPETEVALIQQVSPTGTFEDRTVSTFRRSEKFTLWDTTQRSYLREAMTIWPNASPGETFQYQWIGFMNANTQSRQRNFHFAYLASPRLVPQNTTWLGSDTVKVPPAVHPQKLSQGFVNGDEFIFQIVTTSPVHRDGANENNLSAADRTVKLELLTVEGERAVHLETQNGQTIRVTTKPDGDRQVYLFRGKISANNKVTGLVKVKVSLTSLLNLGESDQQIDESLTISVRDATPFVERVVAHGSGTPAPVYYDSNSMKTSGIVLGENENEYKFTVEVKFSQPMDSALTVISAGKEPPYAKYLVTPNWHDNDTRLTADFEIPDHIVEHGAAILYLAIGGESKEGKALDADPFTPKTQDDISHFVLLEINEFYELTFSAESKAFTVHVADDDDFRKTMRFDPVSIKFNLVPTRYHSHSHQSGADMAAQYESSFKRANSKIDEVENKIKAEERTLKQLKESPEDARSRIQSIEKSIQHDRGYVDSWKAELKWAREHRKLVDAYVRICNGYREYRFDPVIKKSIISEFKGAQWTQDTSLDRAKSNYSVKLRVSADKWLSNSEDDTASWPDEFNVRRLGNFHLSVWNIDKADLKTLSELLAEGLGESSNAGSYYFRDPLKSEIVKLVRSLWDVSTDKSEWPEWLSMNDQDLYKTMQPNSTQVVRLPHMYADTMCKLRLNPGIFYSFPVQGSGTRIDEETVEGGLSNSQTPVIIDAESDHRLMYRAQDPEKGLFYIGLGGLYLFGSDYRVGPKTTPRHGLTTGSVDAQAFWNGNDWFYVHDFFQPGRPLTGSEFLRFTYNDDGQWIRHDTYRWVLKNNGRVEMPSENMTSPVEPASVPATAQPSALGHAVIYVSLADSSQIALGDVAVFIDDRNLPSNSQRQPNVRLADPRNTMRVLSEKQWLVVVNDDNKSHVISSRSMAIAASHRFTSKDPNGKAIDYQELAPGSQHTIKTSQTGLIRIRDAQVSKRRLKLLVVPNDFYGVAPIHGAVLLSKIPIGTYALRVVPSDPRLKPSLHELKITPNEVTRLVVDVESR